MRILIADDDPTSLIILMRSLWRYVLGHEVIRSDHGLKSRHALDSGMDVDLCAGIRTE